MQHAQVPGVCKTVIAYLVDIEGMVCNERPFLHSNHLLFELNEVDGLVI